MAAVSDPLVAFLLEQIDAASEHLRQLDDFWLDTLDDHTGDAVRYFTDEDRIERQIRAWREILDKHQPIGEPPMQHVDCASCSGQSWPCPTVRLMALPYADRLGYDPAWRVE